MRRLTLAASLLAGAVGCRPEADERARDESPPPAVIGETPNAQPDSGTIAVTGPTIVVYFRDAYTAADSGGDDAEALGDLQYYLGTARPALDSLGVKVEERYGGRVDYTIDGARARFEPAADSARAAYLFLSPGAPPQVQYGARPERDLASEARARFGLAAGDGR